MWAWGTYAGDGRLMAKVTSGQRSEGAGQGWGRWGMHTSLRTQLSGAGDRKD